MDLISKPATFEIHTYIYLSYIFINTFLFVQKFRVNYILSSHGSCFLKLFEEYNHN